MIHSEALIEIDKLFPNVIGFRLDTYDYFPVGWWYDTTKWNLHDIWCYKLEKVFLWKS